MSILGPNYILSKEAHTDFCVDIDQIPPTYLVYQINMIVMRKWKIKKIRVRNRSGWVNRVAEGGRGAVAVQRQTEIWCTTNFSETFHHGRGWGEGSGRTVWGLMPAQFHMVMNVFVNRLQLLKSKYSDLFLLTFYQFFKQELHPIHKANNVMSHHLQLYLNLVYRLFQISVSNALLSKHETKIYLHVVQSKLKEKLVISNHIVQKFLYISNCHNTIFN